jgi:hypothetical protein
LALARLRSRLIVPDVVTGFVPPSERVEFGVARVIDVTVPLPLPVHVPFRAKHPVVIFTPTFDVEVAKPAMFNPLTVVVPKPERAISSADVDVVAVPATVVVEM